MRVVQILPKNALLSFCRNMISAVHVPYAGWLILPCSALARTHDFENFLSSIQVFCCKTFHIVVAKKHVEPVMNLVMASSSWPICPRFRTRHVGESFSHRVQLDFTTRFYPCCPQETSRFLVFCLPGPTDHWQLVEPTNCAVNLQNFLEPSSKLYIRVFVQSFDFFGKSWKEDIWQFFQLRTLTFGINNLSPQNWG